MTGRRARATRAGQGRARAEPAGARDAVPSPSPRNARGPKPEDRRRTTRTTRASRARGGDTPEILELDEDGEEVGGEAKGKGRARGRRDASETEKENESAATSATAPAMTKTTPTPFDARDAFLAFLAPSGLGGRAARVPETGGRHVRTARAPRRRGRARVRGLDKRGAFAHARAGGDQRPQRASDIDAGAAAAGTDPSAADARRRALAAAAAAETRLGVSDLARLAETVGCAAESDVRTMRAAIVCHFSVSNAIRTQRDYLLVGKVFVDRQRRRLRTPLAPQQEQEGAFSRSRRIRAPHVPFLGAPSYLLHTLRLYAVPRHRIADGIRDASERLRVPRRANTAAIGREGRVKRALPSETNASIVGRRSTGERAERVIYG